MSKSERKLCPHLDIRSSSLDKTKNEVLCSILCLFLCSSVICVLGSVACGRLPEPGVQGHGLGSEHDLSSGRKRAGVVFGCSARQGSSVTGGSVAAILLVGCFVRVERLAVLAYVNHRRLISNSMI